jgi:ABC-type transport system substrate-binding protein
MASGKTWNRWLAVAGGAALAAGGTWALRRPERGFSPSRSGPHILRRGNSAEPTTLDPHKSANIWEDWIIGDMFVGLMHQDAKGDPVPQGCESITASADGLTFSLIRSTPP